MSYYAFDVDGYLGDVASVQGWTDLAEVLRQSGDPQLAVFAGQGYSENPLALAQALEALNARGYAYDPSQPRAPAGSSEGGRWVPTGYRPGGVVEAELVGDVDPLLARSVQRALESIPEDLAVVPKQRVLVLAGASRNYDRTGEFEYGLGRSGRGVIRIFGQQRSISEKFGPLTYPVGTIVARNTALHEYGHAVDHYLGSKVGRRWLSDSQGFRQAVAEDRAAAPKELRRKLAYYFAGQDSEAFAESFSHLTGGIGVVSRKRFEQAFPSTLKYMRGMLPGALPEGKGFSVFDLALEDSEGTEVVEGGRRWHRVGGDDGTVLWDGWELVAGEPPKEIDFAQRDLQEEVGVWRTIHGRHVFIREGETPEAAIERSRPILMEKEDITPQKPKEVVFPSRPEDVHLRVWWDRGNFIPSKGQIDAEKAKATTIIDRIAAAQKGDTGILSYLTQNDVAPHYEAINSYLRTGDKYISEYLSNEQFNSAIKKLDLVVGRARLPEDITVFRGAYITAQDKTFPRLSVGAVFTDKGYTMGSLSPHYAALFSGSRLDSALGRAVAVDGEGKATGIGPSTHFVRPLSGERFLFMMNLKRGDTAAVPPRAGSYTNENGKEKNITRGFNREMMVVLPRNSKFRVVAMEPPSIKNKFVHVVQIEKVE